MTIRKGRIKKRLICFDEYNTKICINGNDNTKKEQ